MQAIDEKFLNALAIVLDDRFCNTSGSDTLELQGAYDVLLDWLGEAAPTKWAAIKKRQPHFTAVE